MFAVDFRCVGVDLLYSRSVRFKQMAHPLFIAGGMILC